LDNEYAPIAGVKEFVEHAAKLSFITDTTGVIQEKRYAAIQSLSGTGALRIAGEYLNRFKPLPVYLPNPTWGNHVPIFEDSGLKVNYYRYYDAKTKGLDFKGMLEDLNKIPQSAILFHVCAHNPTGVDPSPQQVCV
jgi:aspartate aminotransferase